MLNRWSQHISMLRHRTYKNAVLSKGNARCFRRNNELLDSILNDKHRLNTRYTCEITVGQWKKVTAITFFPARPRLDQTTQIRAKYTKFPLMKSRDILCIEWMWLDLTWVHIPGSKCAWFGRYDSLNFSRGRRLLRFMKKVTLQFRAGKKATHFHYKWFIDIRQADKNERQERRQCEIVNWKYVSRCDEQMKTMCLIRPRGDFRNTMGTEWRRLKHIKKLIFM